MAEPKKTFQAELGVTDSLVHEVSNDSFALRIAACKQGMELELSAIPYEIGKFLPVARMLEIFARFSVSGDVDKEALATFCEQVNAGESVEKVVVVRGKLPEKGRDQAIQFHAKPCAAEPPPIEEYDEKKDYHNLNLFENISKNQLLAELISETEGVSGKTVLGEYVKAVPGAKLARKLAAGQNVMTDDSGNKFYAKLDGMMIYDKRSLVLSVSDVYTIKGDVGYTTGDIDFIGSVEVMGDVSDTYNIKAGKCLTVHKHVGNSMLECGGDVNLHGMDGTDGGSIYCKGDLTAKYLHGVEVECEGDITIQTEAVNCKLHAEKCIVARMGSIIGGEAVALKGIEVQMIGSEAQVRTHVIAGVSYAMQEAIKGLREQVKELKELMNVMSKKLDPFVLNPRNLLALNDDGRAKVKQMAQEFKDVVANKDTLEHELQELSKEARHGANPIVSVVKGVEADVVVTIGSSTEKFRDRAIGQRSYIENSINGGLRPVPFYPLDKSARDIEYAIVQELKKKKERENS